MRKEGRKEGRKGGRKEGSEGGRRDEYTDHVRQLLRKSTNENNRKAALFSQSKCDYYTYMIIPWIY